MHDHRRFPPATPGHYSPAPIGLHEETVSASRHRHKPVRPAPAQADQPLFLDEPEDSGLARHARSAAIPNQLFLDEDTQVVWERSQVVGPAIWDNAEPALSPTMDAQGETRFAPSPRTRMGAVVSAYARPSLPKAVIVIGLALALAAISLSGAQGLSPLSIWHGLGF